jgi:hypothetical protein
MTRPATLGSARAVFAACLLACASVAVASKPKCAVTESMIAGAWTSVSGPSFFEEMAFEYEGGKRVFNSWLHHRPELSGEWRFDDCKLHIRVESSTTTFDFASVRVRGNRLYLREEGKKSEAVYKRIKP